jgi:hypothetical protein
MFMQSVNIRLVQTYGKNPGKKLAAVGVPGYLDVKAGSGSLKDGFGLVGQ